MGDNSILTEGATNNVRGYFLRCVPAVIMSFILAAHFMRWGQPGLVVIAFLSPLLLIFRHKWTLTVYQLLLFAGTARWIQVTILIIRQRSISGQPWTRAGIIMGSVALLTLVSALLLNSRPFRLRHTVKKETSLPSVASFILLSAVEKGHAE